MMAISINKTVFIGAFLIVTLFSGAFGHSYVTSPQTRSNQKETQAGCRGPSCTGPCEIPLSARRTNAAVHVAQRGDSVLVQWPRNNHAGGFIRFAWAPTSQSDNATYFDNHVQQISCHEAGGCYPDDPSNPNGGDSGPGDGSSRACSSTIKIPADLADGKWTLQWSWFGAAFSLGDYYSCVDYSISGGASGSTPVPVFVGGDYSYPNENKCKFFNTDRLHVCVNEPCSNPIFPAAREQSGSPAYVQQNFVGGSPVVNSSSSSSSTTAAAAPITSGSKPSSSGNSKPSTSGAAAPAKPSTTAAAPVPPPSGNCQNGHMKCLSQDAFSTCNWGAWGASQSCSSGTACSESGDYIYCITKANNPTSTSASLPSTTGSQDNKSSSTSGSDQSAKCTLGYQRCVGKNSYQTCGNGNNGPMWYAAQSCQTGLSCHPSATANNIYCY